MPWGALGLFGSALAVWLFVLATVLAALVGIELVRLFRQTRTAEVLTLQNALDAEQAKTKALEARYEHHAHVMLYGELKLLMLPKLSESDLEHLADAMTVLLPFVREARHGASRLTLAMLHEMWETGKGDARHWLAHQIFARHKEALKALELLEDQVLSRSDSREALAAFCAHYWESLEWIERMRSFVKKEPQMVDGFDQWRTHDGQFHAELSKALTIRQFEAVAHWYRSQNRPKG